MEVLLLKRRLFLEEAELHGEEKTQLSFETTSASLLCLSLCWTPIKFDIATLLFLSGARENHHLLFSSKDRFFVNFLTTTTNKSFSEEITALRLETRNHHSWVWQLELDTPIDILRCKDPKLSPFC